MEVAAGETRYVVCGVVVLAGGGSRRLGRDKLVQPLGFAPVVQDAGAGTVLSHLLHGLAGHLPGVPVIAVGPTRPLPGGADSRSAGASGSGAAVRWVREDPAGGGPVAGLARGLVELPDLGADGQSASGLVVVLAGDQPFAAAGVPLLLEASHGRPDLDGVLGRGPDGVDQPLLAAYRIAPLLIAIGDAPAGRSMRSVLAALRITSVPVPERTTVDVDTAADLAHARRLAAQAHGLEGSAATLDP
ncbi:MAG: molybdenum cofactor guanylyltransferase [Angustibacter sp.]